GAELPAPASGAWWAQVPPRFAAAALLTALLVAVFRRFEAPVAGGPARDGGDGLAALGIVLALFGVLGLSLTGFAGLLDGHAATLIAVPVTAPAAVGLALAGWLLVERAGRVRR
ncbi:acyltransferase family protein, partial [Streptomyces sp. NPDC004285]